MAYIVESRDISTSNASSQAKEDVDNFFDHVNAQDPHIKFTCENEVDHQLPFLDRKITRKDNGSTENQLTQNNTFILILITRYHTNSRVIRTLNHRAQTTVIDPQERSKELDHIKGALGNCGYRQWSFDLVNSQSKTSDYNNHPENPQNRPKNNTFITLPFVDGLSQKLQRIFETYGVATIFNPHTTLRKPLVAPKDPTPLQKRSGCVSD